MTKRTAPRSHNPSDEVDPLPLILETQPVGENPEKTGGRLHVTFDSYPLLVKADSFHLK